MVSSDQWGEGEVRESGEFMTVVKPYSSTLIPLTCGGRGRGAVHGEFSHLMHVRKPTFSIGQRYGDYAIIVVMPTLSGLFMQCGENNFQYGSSTYNVISLCLHF